MITPCHPTDAPALAEMLHDLHALHVHYRPDRFHAGASAAERAAFFTDRMAAGAQVLAYRTSGVPRGYLMWEIQDLPATALEHPRRQALLDHIFVEPAWRRRGLATRMLRAFRDQVAAAGLSGWVVRVHSFNAASLALMQRHGAQPQVVQLECAIAPGQPG